jgi:hypothetical protein
MCISRHLNSYFPQGEEKNLLRGILESEWCVSLINIINESINLVVTDILSSGHIQNSPIIVVHRANEEGLKNAGNAWRVDADLGINYRRKVFS